MGQTFTDERSSCQKLADVISITRAVQTKFIEPIRNCLVRFLTLV